MASDLEAVEKEAMALPEPQRTTLVKHLVSSLSDPDLDEVEEAWVEEAQRRYGEYKEGKREAIPEEDLFDGIRRELGW